MAMGSETFANLKHSPAAQGCAVLIKPRAVRGCVQYGGCAERGAGGARQQRGCWVVGGLGADTQIADSVVCSGDVGEWL